MEVSEAVIRLSIDEFDEFDELAQFLPRRLSKAGVTGDIRLSEAPKSC